MVTGVTAYPNSVAISTNCASRFESCIHIFSIGGSIGTIAVSGVFSDRKTLRVFGSSRLPDSVQKTGRSALAFLRPD